jgi:hypothetical protein
MHALLQVRMCTMRKDLAYTCASVPAHGWLCQNLAAS